MLKSIKAKQSYLYPLLEYFQLRLTNNWYYGLRSQHLLTEDRGAEAVSTGATAVSCTAEGVHAGGRISFHLRLNIHIGVYKVFPTYNLRARLRIMQPLRGSRNLGPRFCPKRWAQPPIRVARHCGTAGSCSPAACTHVCSASTCFMPYGNLPK